MCSRYASLCVCLYFFCVCCGLVWVVALPVEVACTVLIEYMLAIEIWNQNNLSCQEDTFYTFLAIGRQVSRVIPSLLNTTWIAEWNPQVLLCEIERPKSVTKRPLSQFLLIFWGCLVYSFLILFFFVCCVLYCDLRSGSCWEGVASLRSQVSGSSWLPGLSSGEISRLSSVSRLHLAGGDAWKVFHSLIKGPIL